MNLLRQTLISHCSLLILALYSGLSVASARSAPISGGGGISFSDTLYSDTLQLEEAVIAVPFGQVKKSTFTGAAQVVTAKELAPRVNTSFVNKLDGIIPGLELGATGRPGASAAIRIRGDASINSGSDPLIVVDGMQYAGNLSTLNPEDMETFVILKDAAATALYGSRAAAGVILITMKKGSGIAQKMEITVKSTFGTTWRYIPEYKRVNAGQYYRLIWEGIRNNRLNTQIGQGKIDEITKEAFEQAGQAASNALIGQLGGYNIYQTFDSLVIDPSGNLTRTPLKYQPEDWSRAFIQTKLRQEHHISVSGNTGNGTNYYLSAGYLSDPGIITNSEFDRWSFDAKLETRVNRALKIGILAMYQRSYQGQARGSGTAFANPFLTSRNMPAIYPVFLRDPETGAKISIGGSDYDFGSYPDLGYARPISGQSNSIGQNFLDVRNTITDQASVRANMELALTEGLFLVSNAGLDFWYSEGITNANGQLGDAASTLGRTTRSAGRTTDVNVSNVLNYRKKWGVNGINIALGHELYLNTSFSLSGARTGFGAARLVELSAGSEVTGANSDLQQRALQGVFTRVAYDFREKYFAEVSLRGDQSSVFAPGFQWGVFWSVGGGWDIAQEDFMRALSKNVNRLKLRASYGVTGNQGSSWYAYQELFGLFPDLSAPGALRSRFGVQNLRWESLGKGDIGLDIGLWKNRINITLDGYYNPVFDMLFERPLAPSVGLPDIKENLGDMFNAGVEFSLNATLVQLRQARGFKLDMGFNAAWRMNRITKLPEANKKEGLIDGSFKYQEGGSIYDFYLREYTGVNAAGRPTWKRAIGDGPELDDKGEQRYDAHGNSLLKNARDTVTTNFDSATRYMFRGNLPKVQGGLNINISYAGFNLYVLTKFSLGGRVVDFNYSGLMEARALNTRNFHEDLYKGRAQLALEADKVVVKQGDGKIPLLGSASQNFNVSSAAWLTDASYFAVKNITLSYDFDAHILKRMRINALRLFMSLENVAYWSRLTRGSNPETFARTRNNLDYPSYRALNVGLVFKL